MPEIEAIVVESQEPRGPYGAKEVGEGGIMPTIPAILNAIYDATGVMIDELPASPERILEGLKRLRHRRLRLHDVRQSRAPESRL